MTRSSRRSPQKTRPGPRYANTTLGADERAEDFLRRMTLDEKLAVIGGERDFYIRGLPRLGLPEIKMSDGPVGCRNYGPTTAYPATIGLAASWSPALAERMGRAMGRDCRARGVHILLAPAVNIYRQPHCGRNFEYMGEDPFLAGRTAVGVIRGIQGQGVVATVKHYIANNQEWDRHGTSSDVDERTLREIYMPAFRAAVREGGVWAVMSSYNLVNGVHASEHDVLLNRVLKGEWGFRGVVMSDWVSVYSVAGPVNGGLDLEMPSGKFMNAANIRPLLEKGEVAEATIDDKVRRILRMIFAMGFYDREQTDKTISFDDPENAAVALEVARQGIVLLKNAGRLLPLNRARTRVVAVIGPNAHAPVTGGGGSAWTQPFRAYSAVEGLRAAAGPGVRVVHVPYTMGTDYSTLCREAVYEGEGLKAEYFNSPTPQGEPAAVCSERAAMHDWAAETPPEGVTPRGFSVRWTGAVRAEQDGEYVFAVSTPDEGAHLWVDDRWIVDLCADPAAGMSVAVLRLRAGQTSRVRVEFHRRSAGRAASFGWGRLTPAMTRKALREIADADAVVVCAGFNSCSETEGRDRTFELPDGQDDLIRRAVRANPRCVVVLNSGGGVDMRAWLDGVPALVQAWYPGQNGNLALGEILFGDLSPSGKLPATFEKRWEDNPVHGTYPPVTRRMPYREGVFIGYRHYDARDIEPQFCFGHGLSYTAFRYSDLRVRTSGAGDDFRVCASARIANVGRRAGAEVVQLYVAAPRGPTPRPPRELKGFARVSLKPGECREVRFELGPEALSFYDPDGQRWAAEPGACEISLAASSRDVRLRATAVPPG